MGTEKFGNCAGTRPAGLGTPRPRLRLRIIVRVRVDVVDEDAAFVVGDEFDACHLDASRRQEALQSRPQRTRDAVDDGEFVLLKSVLIFTQR